MFGYRQQTDINPKQQQQNTFLNSGNLKTDISEKEKKKSKPHFQHYYIIICKGKIVVANQTFLEI